MQQPRILVIQDISAGCRISMNVAVPVLSCLNNAVNVLPTALLSVHTGIEFPEYTFLDLTGEIKKIVDHWEQLKLQFDGILVGYLGSLEQIEMVRRIKQTFLKPDGQFVLDPVMGDHGFLYPGFDYEYVRAMRQLSREAHLIIPNKTEASLLLDIDYQAGKHTFEDVKAMLVALADLNRENVMITGVSFEEGKVGAASHIYGSAEFSVETGPFHPGHFDGAGDLFSCTAAGFLFQRKSLSFAMATAVTYVNKVIVRTIESGAELRYGVQFETDLPFLIEQLYKS